MNASTLTLGICHFLIIMVIAGQANDLYAQAPPEQEYSIEVKTLEIREEQPTATPTPTPTPQPENLIPPGQRNAFEQNGYVVLTSSTTATGLSISRSILSFGEVMPETEQSADVKIAVQSDTTTPYQISAFLDNPIQSTRGDSIINTRCDKAQNPCTIFMSSPWAQRTAYGVGYTMTGDHVPTDFIDETYARPFPILSQRESPQIIASGISSPQPSRTTMTIHVRYPPTQQRATYWSTLYVLSVPEI